MARFPTTHWSAVLEARKGEPAARQRAWNLLAEAYHKPVYVHLRVRWRKAPEDAEDLTQAFFERALEKDFFRRYDREQTRFRSYVRLCLDRFVSNEEKARGRLKRGGGAVELDFEGLEGELERSAANAFDAPDAAFDREYDRVLLALSVEALRQHCEAANKLEHYGVFERHDLAPPDERPSYAELGEALSLPVTTVTNRLSWARRQFRAMVTATLRQLTASEDEYRSELERLIGSGEA